MSFVTVASTILREKNQDTVHGKIGGSFKQFHPTLSHSIINGITSKSKVPRVKHSLKNFQHIGLEKG